MAPQARTDLLRMKGRTYNALFLGPGNSARSIVAECLLRQLGEGAFKPLVSAAFPRTTSIPAVLADRTRVAHVRVALEILE